MGGARCRRTDLSPPARPAGAARGSTLTFRSARCAARTATFRRSPGATTGSKRTSTRWSPRSARCSPMRRGRGHDLLRRRNALAHEPGPGGSRSRGDPARFDVRRTRRSRWRESRVVDRRGVLAASARAGITQDQRGRADRSTMRVLTDASGGRTTPRTAAAARSPSARASGIPTRSRSDLHRGLPGEDLSRWPDTAARGRGARTRSRVGLPARVRQRTRRRGRSVRGRANARRRRRRDGGALRAGR